MNKFISAQSLKQILRCRETQQKQKGNRDRERERRGKKQFAIFTHENNKNYYFDAILHTDRFY